MPIYNILPISLITSGMLPSLAMTRRTDPRVFHAGKYLHHKPALLQHPRATVIGSGQSAAEIFYDLLCNSQHFNALHWYTRSRRFYPMAYTKLALEMSTPDYIHYFYGLPAAQKKAALRDQQYLFKGINAALIDQIYDELYVQRLQQSSSNVTIQTNCELKSIHSEAGAITMMMYHLEAEKDFHVECDAVVLATGYTYQTPSFIQPMRNCINWDIEGNYAVNADYSIDDHHSIFVQNAEVHTHGFNSADLGLGPYRNAVIINAVLGREHFRIQSNVTFQAF